MQHFADFYRGIQHSLMPVTQWVWQYKNRKFSNLKQRQTNLYRKTCTQSQHGLLMSRNAIFTKLKYEIKDMKKR